MSPIYSDACIVCDCLAFSRDTIRPLPVIFVIPLLSFHLIQDELFLITFYCHHIVKVPDQRDEIKTLREEKG